MWERQLHFYSCSVADPLEGRAAARLCLLPDHNRMRHLWTQTDRQTDKKTDRKTDRQLSVAHQKRDASCHELNRPRRIRSVQHALRAGPCAPAARASLWCEEREGLGGQGEEVNSSACQELGPRKSNVEVDLRS